MKGDVTCHERGGNCMVCFVRGCLCPGWDEKPIRGNQEGSLAHDFVKIIEQARLINESRR